MASRWALCTMICWCCPLWRYSSLEVHSSTSGSAGIQILSMWFWGTSTCASAVAGVQLGGPELHQWTCMQLEAEAGKAFLADICMVPIEIESTSACVLGAGATTGMRAKAARNVSRGTGDSGIQDMPAPAAEAEVQTGET